MDINVELLVYGTTGGTSGQTCVGSVDLHGDEPIQLNIAVADIKDISQKKSTYSQSFVVPGTKNNNTLFNYLFEIGSDSLFNPGHKTPCQLLVDTIPVMSNGNLQLTGINIDDQNNISYQVTIFDETEDLIDAIGDLELTDLNFSAYNHTYTYDNAINSWTGSSQPYFYPLIDYGYDLSVSSMNAGLGVDFLNTSLYPATQIKTIWDLIFTAAGYTYSSNFLNSTYFENLYSPYTGSLVLTQDESFVSGRTFDAQIGSDIIIYSHNVTSNTLANDSGQLPFSASTVIVDPGNHYNASTWTYSADTNMVATINIHLEFDNRTNGTAPYDLSIPPTISVFLYRSSQPLAPYVQSDHSLPYSNTRQTLDFPFTLPSAIQIQQGETFYFTFSVFQPFQSAIIDGLPIFTLYAVNSNWSLVPSTEVLPGQLITYNSFIPKKIKQIDFLTSIMTMHNLYVVSDKYNPKKLTIEPRDAYYSGGTIKDWTTKLDLSQPVNQTLLSEQSNKRIVFSYKADKDYYNDNYSTATNKIFGDEYVTIDNDFVKDDQDISVIFSPTPNVAVLETGVFVPVGLTAATANNFVIAKIGKVTSNTNFGATEFNIRILQKNNSNLVQLQGETWKLSGVTQSSYPYLGMLDHPSTGTTDIAFGTVDYEYYQLPYITSNNLVNAYWRGYLNQISDKDSKLITCSIYLTPSDIQAFKFNDSIYIDGLSSDGLGAYFLVNNITYVASSNQPSLVELIQVKNQFVPVTTKSIRVRPTGTLQALTLGGAQSQSTAGIAIGLSSWILPRSTGSVVIGNGSVIMGGSPNSMAIGSGDTIGSNSYNTMVIGNNSIVGNNSSNAVIFGTNSSIASGITGSTVFGSNIHAVSGNTLYTNNIVISSGSTFNGVNITTLISGSTLWSGDSLGNILANNGSGNYAYNVTGYAYAEGFSSSALGEASHAEGSSEADGNFSHSESGGYVGPLGTYSHAEGASIAWRDYSHAEGQSVASASTSHAEGLSTTTLGLYSHSEGQGTIASGTTSHAEGLNTRANGNYSHSEGGFTTAQGNNSHAEGNTTTALGSFSHSEGNTTIANGTSAHAEGGFTTASGNISHAEGNSTTASGSQSHSEGASTTASGSTAHAEGQTTIAGGVSSHAGGSNSSALGITSFVHSNFSTDIGSYSAILGGQNNLIPNGITESVILGGNGLTATTSDYVYVPSLNINTVFSGTSLYNLGIDANGNVIIGSAGSTSPIVVASNDLTGRTTAIASIATYTTSGIGTYRVGGYINVTAILTDVIQLQVTYTDENGTAQTEIFASNSLSTSVNSIGNNPMFAMDIRVKAGTTITIKTVLTTGVGTITYDVGGNIIKLY